MVARFGGQTGSAVLFPDVGGAGLGTFASLGGDGMLVFLAELFDLLSGISVGIQKFLRHCGSTSWAASSSSPAQSFGAVRGTDFWRCLRWFGKSVGIWWYLLASACFSLSEGLGYRLHAPGFLQGPSRAAVPFLRCPGCGLVARRK